MIKRLRFVFLFVVVELCAQQPKDSIYTFQAVEIKPSYPGGMTFFNEYIADHFQIPKNVDFKGGKLLVDFVIDTTGTICDVRILRDIGFGTAEEAKRILPLSEKWIPGKQNMKKVKVRYAFPLTIPAYDPTLEIDEQVYDAIEVDEKANYPGGVDAFRMMIARNFQMPKIENLSGKILCTFVIETDGSVSDVKVLQDVGHGTGKEAKRVIGLSDQWIPAKKDGKSVRTLFSIPINVKIGR